MAAVAVFTTSAMLNERQRSSGMHYPIYFWQLLSKIDTVVISYGSENYVAMFV